MEIFLREFQEIDLSLIKFGRITEATLIFFVIGAVFLSALLIKYLRRGQAGQRSVVLPSILPVARRSGMRFIRHIPHALFIMGLPFFFIALADPYQSFAKENITTPGKRIAVLIDASGSMDGIFSGGELERNEPKRFYSAVAATEYFMRLRIDGKYNDLMALLEFGNESFVITPFTNDYKNILTSVSLIGEKEERTRFGYPGTVIIKAIDQAVELFRTFGFLEASGNIMVLISDGEDTQYILDGRPLTEIISGAKKNQIPIYFIRTGNSSAIDETDLVWKKAVESTGGKFYPVADEKSIINATNDIDKAASGVIKVNRYSTKKPLFGPFLATASFLWALAVGSTLLFSIFRKFP